MKRAAAGDAGRGSASRHGTVDFPDGCRRLPENPYECAGESNLLRHGIIFFDIGGTLATGAEQSPRRLLASRLGLSEKETRLVGRLIMVHPATEPRDLACGLERVLPGHDPRHILCVLESVWSEQARCMREIPGATPLVGALKEMGFKVGVISNTWHPLYEGFRTACAELAGFMDYTFLSYRRGVKKPSTAFFTHAAGEAGVPAGLCWMVGDTYELDVAPARLAGMRTIWVLGRPERETPAIVEMLQGAIPSPHWTVGNIQELIPYFERM